MTRSSITSSKSSGKTNTANSTSFITTKSTFPRSTATTSSCYPAEAGELLALIEHCKTTHDILGVCLGHQAIAESFGASLQQLPLPKHGHESPLTIVDPTDILYHGLTYPVQVGRYHSWIVNPHTLPSCLRISALDEEGHIMSFYHTSLPIRGVQYHPESIITRQGRQMINNWINEEKSL